MTFCKEMSSRVEEPFCKNICFLGIDTKYCSDLYMFLIRLNHLIAVLGSNVRHSSSFRAAMAAILDLVEAPTFFLVLCWPRMAKDLLQVVSVTTFTAILCSFCTCSFVFNFYFFSKTHVITQTRDIMRGVLGGNEAKETNIQKYKTT